MVRTVAALTVFLAVASAAPPARIGSGGVTTVLPAGWHTWRPLPGLKPQISEPATRIVAISAPFGFAARGCQVAAFSFPADAVALVVVEWVHLRDGSGWGRRPLRFTRANLPLHPPPWIECWGGPGGAIQFVDRGRHFGAYLLAGRRARPALVDRARAVLDTLRVAPR
jgi:hypothetical protein